MKKVLISCPTAQAKDYCADEFIEQIKSFTYPLYDIFILDNSPDKNHVYKFWNNGIKAVHEPFNGNFKAFSGREELARHQNIIRNYFLNGDYDYLLMIESDVFTGESIIENLVSYANVYNAGAVTVTYEIRKEEEEVLCLTSTVDQLGVRSEKLLNRSVGHDVMGQGTLPLNHLLNDTSAKITATGIGCTLFTRDVMENIEFRVDRKLSTTAYSDTYIFTDIKNAGYEVLINSNLICTHKK
tara:strand:- start:20982 stop:21704 length:723 start_codon:yes stop_codon:yes gene_type:complete